MQSPRFAALRDIEDDQRRGYVFESYVREILPWSLRPPLQVNTKSEQIDAFFEFNGWHFLVESKAKRHVITPGSSDWEDFELKIRRRGGICVGLFCSLWPISDSVFSAAANLNKAHHTTIIIAGSQWDDLEAGDLSCGEFLRFLVSEARSKHRTIVPPLAEIHRTLLLATDAEQVARTALRPASTTFLRRHRTPRHDQIYVSRGLDRDITDLLQQLTPSRLLNRKKKTRHGDTTVEHTRAPPHQIAIVRDLSGAGKTTLAVQLTSGKQHLAICRAALETDIDNIGEHLNQIGPNYGLSNIMVINKPIIYILDSLDEASTIPQKHVELRAVFNTLEVLNGIARSRALLCFPLLIMLTIRDEYWRDWESQLEGRPSRVFSRRFSRFTDTELDLALARYQSTYQYEMQKPINPDLRDALSHPFTLQVYSEANEYGGLVDTKTHLASHVLSLFFERKKEDLSKRPVLGLDGDLMMTICSELAVEMIILRQNEINDDQAIVLIERVDPLLTSRASDILRSLRSEQIFAPDGAKTQRLRFRHGRFLEYLVATRVLDDLQAGRLKVEVPAEVEAAGNTLKVGFLRRGRRRSPTRASLLGLTISEIYDAVAATAFASPFVVLDYLRAIASDNAILETAVRAALANSTKVMGGFLLRKRGDLASGSGLVAEEARAVQIVMAERDASFCWNGYFVLSAASSRQSPEVTRQAFIVTWDVNKGFSELYKLIPKLKRSGLLLDEDVVRRIVKCEDAKCWLSFLDQFDERMAIDFPDFWGEINGSTIEAKLEKIDDFEWKQVLRLLSYLKRGRVYPIGSLG